MLHSRETGLRFSAEATASSTFGPPKPGAGEPQLRRPAQAALQQLVRQRAGSKLLTRL